MHVEYVEVMENRALSPKGVMELPVPERPMTFVAFVEGMTKVAPAAMEWCAQTTHCLYYLFNFGSDFIVLCSCTCSQIQAKR